MELLNKQLLLKLNVLCNMKHYSDHTKEDLLLVLTQKQEINYVSEIWYEDKSRNTATRVIVC